MASVRAYWRSLGLSNDAMNTMMERWATDTRQQYARNFGKFVTWRGGDATKVVTPVEVVNYLATLQRNGCATRTLLSQATSVMAIPKATDQWADPTELVSRFIRGARKSRPVRDHRADPIPSLQPLFAWLATSRDPASRRVSRIRAVTLCRFVTLARSKDMEGWLAESVRVSNDSIVILTERTKGQPTSRSYIIPRYTDNDGLCPYTAFLDYWSLMRSLGTSTFVWRAITQPFDRISADTIGRITREALEAAGIRSDQVRPHSLRAVAASQALALGAPSDEVQTAGGWRSAQTMYDFYVRRPEAGANVARVLFRLFDDRDGDADHLGS